MSRMKEENFYRNVKEKNLWNRRITMLLTVAFLISLAYYFGVVDGRKEEYVCRIAEWECTCADRHWYSTYDKTGDTCVAMYFSTIENVSPINCSPVEKCRWRRD